MKSYDVVGYVGDGVAYCPGCNPDPDNQPIFADSEWDSYPSCDVCKGVIDEVSLIGPCTCGSPDCCDINNNPFKCPECGQVFYSSNGRDEHITKCLEGAWP